MENFVVSARKYRPATFDTVIGQKSITNTLKNAIRNGQLAQAFLFTGPRGIGKTTCARILAKTINCMNRTSDVEPCNSCESCVSFNNNASFNIHELDAASNNSVDDIRQLVEQVRVPPQVGKYKVYIIDEIHMLSSSAFNTFLKTLEEPPSYAKFILATTEKHKIIPTILSRCQIYDFRRITVEDIAGYLAYVATKENIKAEPNALHIIATKADGALRDALSMFDQISSFSGNNLTYKNVIENLNILDYEYYFRLIKLIINNDKPAVLLLLNEVLENGFDGQQFIIGLGEHLRNLLVCRDKETLKLLEISKDFIDRYADQARHCSNGFLIAALDILNFTDLNYKSSNNKRLFLELSLIKIAGLTETIAEGPEKKKPEPELNKSIKKDPIATETSHVSNKKTSVDQNAQTPPHPIKTEIPAREEDDDDEEQLLTGTISIKDAIKGNNSTKNNPDLTDDSNKPSTRFSLQELQKKWERFAHEVRETHASYSVAMLKNIPDELDGPRVVFKTDNRLLASDKVFLANLLNYLKQELNNYSIIIITHMIANDTPQKAYTDKEKFERMSAANPALIKLKTELDLEIEF